MSEQTEAFDALLADLNEQQRKAVCHRDGPLLVIAGAGTGKTSTLAHRVAYLIAAGADPGRILLLTFTRRAAAEMLRRVEGILRGLAFGPGEPALRGRTGKTWGGTFHAIASRLLRRHGKLIGLEPEFTILDRGDSEDLCNVVRAELGLTESQTRFPLKGTCAEIYSRCVNTQERLEVVLPRDFPWCVDHAERLKQLFREYVDRKEAQTVLDYDDLLLFWHALLSDPASGAVVRGLFDCVLVDEYQDTNVLQAEILQLLQPDGTGLTVVGDDAQSIYSFRAATVRNILDFPESFPGTEIVTLEKNYRSTQPILDATNRVISHAAERYAKNLHSARDGGTRPQLVQCIHEDEQTDFIIDRILEHRESGIELKQQAVLFRASHHALALEVELSRRKIPFHKYGGLRFIETAHVKDLMAFLRLAENPRDAMAGTRVLTLLPGIGHAKARGLLDLLHQADTRFKAWTDYKPPAAASTLWPDFVALMRRLTSGIAADSPIADEVHQVRTFYAPLLERRLDQVQARLRDLEQLEQVACRFPNRTSFLSEVTLDPPASTQDLAANPLLDEDYLILSTIHSAKGLEWDAVYVMHAADGNIPSDMSTRSDEEIEEERRLFYVALTRARDWLYVCHPQRYYFHGRYRSDAHSFAQLTRFLPEDVHPFFERRTAGPDGDNLPTEKTSDVPTPQFTTADVRKRAKNMWQ